MTDGVKRFLEKLGMFKYYEIFCAKGFDLESDIPNISGFDLKESLMISNGRDRAVIFAHAQQFKTSREHDLYEWLHRHSLDHYFINFIQSDIIDLDTVALTQLPNEELYDELEIVLPGHKRRLERAVANLQSERGILSASSEIPVTHGWWGKPECLPQAKFDFLCVKAQLFASHEPNNKANIDFMVDSGSDVSTVQERTLKTLNLQLIGPIYSCGIHGGNHTNLYRAQLKVGEEKLEIEVMASNYDSLGSRIVRHFRHVIDGNRHIWLKGNYKDPLPAVLPLAISSKPRPVTDEKLAINESKTVESRLDAPPTSSPPHLMPILNVSNRLSSPKAKLGFSDSDELNIFSVTENSSWLPGESGSQPETSSQVVSEFHSAAASVNNGEKDLSGTFIPLTSSSSIQNTSIRLHQLQTNSSSLDSSISNSHLTIPVKCSPSVKQSYGTIHNGTKETETLANNIFIVSGSTNISLQSHNLSKSSPDSFTDTTTHVHQVKENSKNISNYQKLPDFRELESREGNGATTNRDKILHCDFGNETNSANLKHSSNNNTDVSLVLGQKRTWESSDGPAVQFEVHKAKYKKMDNTSKNSAVASSFQELSHGIKDTDDDIDHMDSVLGRQRCSPPLFSSYTSTDFGDGQTYQGISVAQHGPDLSENQDGVIHILQQDDEPDKEMFENVNQHKNCMLGKGTSVIISMDDFDAK